MPYISKRDRGDFVMIGPKRLEGNPGLLNYVIHQALDAYMLDNGLSYRTINDVLGVLSATSMEYYRRLAAPYEDQKRELSGDIEVYKYMEAK